MSDAPEPFAPEPADDASQSGTEADDQAATEAALGRLADRESAYGLLQRAHRLMSRRHDAQAAILLERAARLEPGRGSIVEALGRAYYNSGQHARAIEAFEELLRIDPSAHYGHYGLGQSLKRGGRRDEARTHLRMACAMAPHSTLYRAALARID